MWHYDEKNDTRQRAEGLRQKDSKPKEDQRLFLSHQVTNCIRSAPSVVTAGVCVCVCVCVCGLMLGNCSGVLG